MKERERVAEKKRKKRKKLQKGQMSFLNGRQLTQWAKTIRLKDDIFSLIA